MKKTLLLSFLFCFSGVSSQLHAQLLTISSFENWTSGVPDGFTTTGPMSSISQSADAKSGSSAIKFQVVNDAGNLVCAPITGAFGIAPQVVKTAGIWYKAVLDSGDYFSIPIKLTDTVSSCSNNNFGYRITNGTSTYAYSGFNIDFGGSCLPNLFAIINAKIMNDSSSRHIGSYVIVDDVTISSAAVGLQTIRAGAHLEKIFPNPARNGRTDIVYSLSTLSKTEINVYDLSGKRLLQPVNEIQNPGHYKAVISPGVLPAGVYLCELKTEDGSSTMKLVICN